MDRQMESRGEHLQDAVISVLFAVRDAVEGASRLAMLKEKECLTPAEVEELYSVPASTLATRRCRGGGPDYTQLADDGGKILYRHEDVKHWLANRHRRG